ncbi:hypothetical protein [Dysgonomonas sp. ZJ709]|uniref:hypothetical protein n=1 Tax=Dysgonomonas sp. ZJ709 TaxID=2709797 RepID=UPI0013EDC6AF|nr:hypothetical protein [Dysgonomonas sp. ZJ709]
MKKLLFALFCVALISCSKDNNDDLGTNPDPETPILGTGDPVERFFSEKGLKPSNQEQISFIQFYADNVDYKLAGGRKNGKAWLAKFKPNGEEIFSFELDAKTEDKSYGHYYANSLLFADKKYIFIVGRLSNWKDLYNDTDEANKSFTSVISVINSSTGKESNRFMPKKAERFQVEQISNYYLIQEGDEYTHYSQFHILDNDGKTLWSREVTDQSEKERGINLYDEHCFIDAERIIFVGYTASAGLKYVYRIINLKELKLITELPVEGGDYKLTGDNAEKPNIIYKRKNIKMYDKNIRITFEENLVENVTNEATGSVTTTETTLGTYYYDLDSNTYKVIGKGKL